MSGAPREGDIFVVADAHLADGDRELATFCEFLAELPGRADVLVLLGDVFALWIADPKLTLPHHRVVLEACRAIRGRGVRVVFVEGNREFGAGRWEGDAFDQASDGFVRIPWAGRRWLFAHGDLLDVTDRGTRLFRRVARSWPVRRLVSLLPSKGALSLASWIETRLHDRNLPRKTSLPPERFRSFASWVAQQECDMGAIGHIHVEMKHVFDDLHGRERTLFVLPDWRSSHRYLRIDRTGDARFVAWGGRAAPAPAIVGVEQGARHASIELERDGGFMTGEKIAIESGHGDPPRHGEIRDVREARSSVGDAPLVRIEVALSEGAPVRVGDRVSRRAGASGEGSET